MTQATFHFPRGFLWGTATASHQVEGNNKNNNWWAWEGEPGRILDGQRSGLACDWWGGRWREDFDRAVETGQNAHRLSIEWSRVQPSPDRWDESAIDQLTYRAQRVRLLAQTSVEHYRRLLEGLSPAMRQEIGARQRRGEELRPTTIGIGGLDLGMEQVLDRAQSGRLDAGGEMAPGPPGSAPPTGSRPFQGLVRATRVETAWSPLISAVTYAGSEPDATSRSGRACRSSSRRSARATPCALG